MNRLWANGACSASPAIAANVSALIAGLKAPSDFKMVTPWHLQAKSIRIKQSDITDSPEGLSRYFTEGEIIHLALLRYFVLF